MTGMESLVAKVAEASILEVTKTMEVKAVSEGAIPRAEEWQTANAETRDEIANKLSDRLGEVEKRDQLPNQSKFRGEVFDGEDANAEVRKVSPYSEEINERISSTEELNVYKDQGLIEGKVGDKTALLSPDIDMVQKDGMGRTNATRMDKGLAPLDSNGESYNLHHIGQKSDSPLAELPNRVHKENDAVLHDKNIRTEVHGADSTWDSERADYWKQRGEISVEEY